MNQTDVDVSHLVDAAFKESECVGTADVPCGGEHRGYVVGHDCGSGLLCANHWDNLVMNVRPAIKASIREKGGIICSFCGKAFEDIDTFQKVYPL